MSGDKRARLKQWLESGEARLEPLTFPQRELWEASPVPVADASNHICCLIHVRGLITQRDCQVAVEKVVERQEALRLSFLPGKDHPLQMVRKTSGLNFRFRELSSSEGRPEAVEALALQIFDEPFDLLQGPLYRIELLRRAADDYVLVFAIHHAIADGWTLGVFVEDLCGAYVQSRLGLAGPLPPVPLSYTAWGNAERAAWHPEEVEQRAAFWKSHLAGTHRLWTTRDQAHGVSTRPRRWVASIPADLTSRVRELARRTGATLFSMLLAAFQIALFRWTGSEDIVVGTPVANRNTQAVRETMGYCAGIVPLRWQIDGSRPFADNLRAAHQTTVDSFSRAMPFAELARAVGDLPAPGYNPVFEVRFALQNHPIPDVALPELSARLRMRSTGTSRFDLGCEITEEGEALEVVWLFQPGRFADQDIEDLDKIFRVVLTGACRSPDSRISTLV